MRVSTMVNDISCNEVGRKGIKTILVPTDFSEPSDAALQIAIDLAKQQSAKIHLLHVLRFRQAEDKIEMAREIGSNLMFPH
jgi:nucleotide-binding universal stress UspA family protein